MFAHFFFLSLLSMQSGHANHVYSTVAGPLSLPRVLRPFQLQHMQHRSLASVSNDTAATFLRRLNPFSKLKQRKRRDPASDLVAADSSHVMRMSPVSAYAYAPPMAMAMRPYTSPMPLTSASLRAYNYFPSPYMNLMSADPFAARRMAMAQRPTYMPAAPMPAYFPLGSMTGTPILDPSFQAALASSLVNRYSPALPLVGGSSYLSSGLYDDAFDQASIATALKRYLNKSNKKSKYNKYSEDLAHKSEYDSYSPRYDSVSKMRYTTPRPSRGRDDRLKGYDYTVDRSVDDARAESQYPIEEIRFDGRAVGSDGAPATPPLPRYRERGEVSKDATSEPFVDMYGWHGPSRGSSGEGEGDAARGRSERYSSDALRYGSRSASLSPATSYDKAQDGEGETMRS